MSSIRAQLVISAIEVVEEAEYLAPAYVREVSATLPGLVVEPWVAIDLLNVARRPRDARRASVRKLARRRDLYLRRDGDLPDSWTAAR